MEAKIATLVTSEPSRAVALYETFLAACYSKVEELDDSSGSFSRFVGDLYCVWIKARQAAEANPDETAARMLSWMDVDDYGFCYQLEKKAAKAFDKAGLVAFVTQVRARFAAAKAGATPAGNGAGMASRPFRGYYSEGGRLRRARARAGPFVGFSMPGRDRTGFP